MADVLLPTWLKLARTRIRYRDNSGASRGEYTGAVKVASKGGDKLSASIEFSPTLTRSASSAIERGALIAFMNRLRGKQNPAYLTDPAYRRRGSFPAVELLPNGTFANGTTGWTPSSADIELYSGDRVLRSTRAAVVSNESIAAAASTTTASATYVARVFAYAGAGAMDYRLRLGTSVGGSEVAGSSSDYTTQGLQTLVGTASGGTTYFGLFDGINGRSIGHFMDFAYCSMSRCALVNGGSQTGSAMNIDQLPANTNGLLLMGDQFEVITSRGSELKIVTAPLNSNASGQGYLQFEPPLRGVPVDNAPVIIHEPMGRFVYMGEYPEWLNEPGIITTASLDGFEEAA